jgi:hypothetical protein
MDDPFYNGHHPGDDHSVPKLVSLIIGTVLFVIAVALAAAALKPAHAQVPMCVTPAFVMSTLKQDPHGVGFGDAEYAGGHAAIRLADKIWPSDDDNDEVTDLVIVELPRRDIVRVIFFKLGCVDGSSDFPRRDFDAIAGRRGT